MVSEIEVPVICYGGTVVTFATLEPHIECVRDVQDLNYVGQEGDLDEVPKEKLWTSQESLGETQVKLGEVIVGYEVCEELLDRIVVSDWQEDRVDHYEEE